MTASSSGQTIFVRPGTYTENLTLKAGVDIVAFSGDQLTPNVTISGTCTFTGAGTVTLANLRLQTNSAAAIAVTGSSASILNINNCYLNFTNNDGITFSSSSASAKIDIRNCLGNLGTTGIKIFAHSSSGALEINRTTIANSGASTTASTASAGTCGFGYSQFASPITTSGSNTLTSFYTSFNCLAINSTALTMGGTAATAIGSEFAGGTASAISTSSTLTLSNCAINSSNTNAITGAGTLVFSGLSFESTSSTINTTTQTARGFNPGLLSLSRHDAFSAYLASTALNKTGTGTNYTLGTDALTEIFDNVSSFNTNGTFTASVTGKYFLSAITQLTGCTINTANATTINTSNRNYNGNVGRAASATNISYAVSVLADMDAADTATVSVAGFGEAGDTDDILGGANMSSGFMGFMVTT